MFDKLYDKIIIPNKINIKYDKIINIFNLIMVVHLYAYLMLHEPFF